MKYWVRWREGDWDIFQLFSKLYIPRSFWDRWACFNCIKNWIVSELYHNYVGLVSELYQVYRESCRGEAGKGGEVRLGETSTITDFRSISDPLMTIFDPLMTIFDPLMTIFDPGDNIWSVQQYLLTTSDNWSIVKDGMRTILNLWWRCVTITLKGPEKDEPEKVEDNYWFPELVALPTIFPCPQTNTIQKVENGKISGRYVHDTVNSDIPVPWGRGQSQTH